MSEEIKKEAQDTELNLEELGEVAGGYIFGGGTVRDRPWEVISDFDGSVIARFATKEEAVNAAKSYGMNVKQISYSALCTLRAYSELNALRKDSNPS